MNSISILRDGCEFFQVPLDQEKEKKFERYYELLVKWNEVMNLTAITEREEVMQKHFVDSLALAKAVDMSGCETLIDVGTGAGFPGLPLKIVFPRLKVVLLDSLNKRIRFLNEVIEELGLENVETIHGRAEDMAKQKEYRENFDLCVSRAVANLSSLSEYCIPYVKQGGMFVSYKSGTAEEEAEQAKKAIYLLGGETKKIEKFQLPGSDIQRSLIVVEKVRTTPKKYPRKSGIPGKEPL